MWAAGTGADVMKRLAAPMVGGVASAMLLTLLVIPMIYAIWRWHTDVKRARLQLEKGLGAETRGSTGFYRAIPVHVARGDKR